MWWGGLGRRPTTAQYTRTMPRTEPILHQIESLC